MNNSSTLPIPSFIASDQLEDSQYSTDLDEDDDDELSIQTQYDEGANEDKVEYCTQAMEPTTASVDTEAVPKQATELSNEVIRPDLEESSPLHREREPTSWSKESSFNEAEIPPRHVTRSSTHLERTRTSVLTDHASSETAPPLSPPDTIAHEAAVVSPSPARSRSDSTSSASWTPDTSSSNRKRAGKSSSGTSKKKKKKSILRETTDFAPKTAEAFNIPVHTLILGNHPSNTALELNEYYGHKMSAFWWIVGDCFGFRRAEPVTTTGMPLKNIAGHLRKNLRIIPYEMQLKKLCCNGFALWNILHKCKRRGGSSDRYIEGGVPNDIRKWCQERPSIRRIVFSHGKSTFNKFAEHFQDWVESGELVPSPHKASQEAFAKYNVDVNASPDRTIECVVAIAVSSTVASVNYSQKRDFWKKYVFNPGFQDFEEWENSAVARGR